MEDKGKHKMETGMVSVHIWNVGKPEKSQIVSFLYPLY